METNHNDDDDGVVGTDKKDTNITIVDPSTTAIKDKKMKEHGLAIDDSNVVDSQGARSIGATAVVFDKSGRKGGDPGTRKVAKLNLQLAPGVEGEGEGGGGGGVKGTTLFVGATATPPPTPTTTTTTTTADPSMSRAPEAELVEQVNLIEAELVDNNVAATTTPNLDRIVDNLEAKIQERVDARTEQIRQEILHNAVQADVITVDSALTGDAATNDAVQSTNEGSGVPSNHKVDVCDDEEKDKMELGQSSPTSTSKSSLSSSSEGNPKNRCIAYVVGLLVIVIVIAVAVALTVKPSSSDDKQMNQTQDGLEEDRDSTEDEVKDDSALGSYEDDPPKEEDSRYEQLITIVKPFYDNTGLFDDVEQELLRNTTTSQYDTLQWLATIDDPNMLPNLQTILNDMKDDAKMMNGKMIADNSERVGGSTTSTMLQKFLDRYVATLVYFATDGINKWEEQFNFLNTTVSVCDWNHLRIDYKYGIECDIDSNGLITKLALDNNDVHGTIPFEIGWLSALDRLSFALNDVGGTIPETIADLTRLENLHLQYNDLTGTIPDRIGTMTNLRWVYLMHNQLSGTIPNTFLNGDLRKLQIFNVNTNNLNGTIPEFGIQDELQLISLSWNDLTGTIPTTVSKLFGLQSLFVNSCQLSGRIPTEIGALEELEVLSLYENQFTGAIPAELSGARELEHFYLGTNLLEGTIPSELGLLDRLVWFAVEANMLTGTLPDELFVEWTDMEVIELQKNQLTGTIPSTFVSMAELVRVNMYNNSLTGNLDPLICNETSGVLVREASADCRGKTPEVTCTCCAECCSDIDGCPFDTGQKACNRDKASFEASSNLYECDCFPEGGQTVIHSFFDKGAYELHCFLPGCKFCDPSSTNCAFQVTGRKYDASGTNIGGFVRYEHFLGEHVPNVVYHENLNADGGECTISIGGEVCNDCADYICADGAVRPDFDCRNVEPDAALDRCAQALEESYGTDEQLSSSLGIFNNDCIIHNPGFCPKLLETLSESFGECSCSDDGLVVKCHEQCKYCPAQNVTTAADVDDDGETECFTHETEFHFLDDGSGTFHDYYRNFRYSNSLSSITDTSSLRLSPTNDTFCSFSINGEVCSSCIRTNCTEEDDPNSNFQVDCGNIQEGLSFDQCNNATWSPTGIMQVWYPGVVPCTPYNRTAW